MIRSTPETDTGGHDVSLFTAPSCMDMTMDADAFEALLPLGCDPQDAADMVRHPDMCDLVDRITRRLVNTYRIDWVHRDDVAQECRLVLWEACTQPSARASLFRSSNGLATGLFFRCRDRVRALADRGQWSQAPTSPAVQRRRRALEAHRQRMAQATGEWPTDEQLLADYNSRVTSRRTDAAKQGAVACLSDLRPAPVRQLDDHPGSDEPDPARDMDFCSVEARPLLAAILRRAAACDDELRRVADEWLGHFDDDPPFIATVAEVSTSTGIPPARVRQVRDEVVVLARVVLAEEFGIDTD